MMADEEKPPEVVLDIEKIEAAKRSIEETLGAAGRLAVPLSEKLLAIEKMSGLTDLTERMRLLHRDSAFTRVAEQIRIMEESSPIRQLQKQMQLIGENSTMARFSEQMRLMHENSALVRFSENMRLFEENSTVRHLAETLNRTGELARAAMGPMWELRDAGLLDIAGRREFEAIRKAVEGFESNFRLPAREETAQITKLLQENAISGVAARWAQQASSITRAIDSMKAPWLDIHDKIRSITGLAEMQGIGLALQNVQGFEEHLSSMLRVDLGDWRDPITWRPDILEDFKVRSDFYVGLGFNPRLTDFPLPAFEQSLDIAGLRQDAPPLIGEYGPPIPFEPDEDEDGLARTNNAHDWLQRLERLLRRFIDEQLTRAIGANWPKHRLPGGCRDRWEEKKRKAREAGAPDLPLICYADFTDYVLIICRSDNWRDVFAAFFKRPDDVRESFQRLHPIRLDTAHARLISQDDELLLYVEVKRLCAAIRRPRN
jgi:hypothetical protein